MSLFRAPNQALAMKWGPMSIDLNGKPIIRRITVTTSCHHFVPRTTTEVSRVFVQIFMGRIWPTSGHSEGSQALSWIVPSSRVDPIRLLKSEPWTSQKPHHPSWCWLKPSNVVRAIWTQTWGKTLALHNVLVDYAMPWTLDGLYPSNSSRNQQGTTLIGLWLGQVKTVDNWVI